MIKGFDTAQRITADHAKRLKLMGYDYALRYLVPQNYSKAMTKAEMQGILGSGMMLGFCWETTASRAKSGTTAGMADGESARKLALDMGIPSNAVIYFAVDYDAPKNDYNAISAYMVAAQMAVRPYRMGIYGKYDIVEHFHTLGVGDAFWQCVAWSGGKWSEHATIQQREWNVSTGVVTVDNNYCTSVIDAGLIGDVGVELRGYSFVKLYNNCNKKTPYNIKAETGCDALVNGGLFTLKDFKPVCQLKINNVTLAKDEYKYWGYGIDKDGKMTLSQDPSAFPNYIACCCMVKDGKAEKLIYNADMGGKRQRTAIGTLPDGSPWGYFTMYPTTPEQLQAIALNMGVQDAIMLDGGASTWAITPTGEYKGGRIAHNYVLFFKDYGCPYKEPTENIKMWSVGEGAKWVQWMLKYKFGYILSVDGIFLKKSVNVLTNFQKIHGLTADGICGKLTRAKLKGG